MELKQSLLTNCIGGGRIKHVPKEKYIIVYGYSQSEFLFLFLSYFSAFGRSDHNHAKELLQEIYPDYTIETSNEGY